MWYNDLSAEAIGNEYANLTVKVLSNQVLNDLDYERIKEGDIVERLILNAIKILNCASISLIQYHENQIFQCIIIFVIYIE